MIEINLYKPDVVDIKVPFPTTWNELTLDELEFIGPHVLTEKEVHWEIIFLEILRLRLARITPKCNAILKKMDPEQLFVLGLPLIEFIKDENTLTNFPYEELQGIDIPKKDFNSMQVVMYENAVIFSHKWRESTETKDFMDFIKAIMNPYQYRERFILSAEGLYNRYKSRKANKAIDKLSNTQLRVIFLWYIGCENRLPLLFPRIYEGGSSGKGSKSNFTKCIHQAATSGNYKRSGIRQLLLKELLFDIECALEAQEKLEEKNKTNG